MNSLHNPPTDPGQVVIVIQRQPENKLLAATFKYKKGKWVGVMSGDRYTTDQLIDLQYEACWIVSPIQPNYEI